MAAPENQNLAPTTDKPPRLRRCIPASLRIFLGMVVLVGVWGSTSAYRRGVAIREVKHFNGSIQYLSRQRPEWQLAWIGDERMQWFDDPDHIVFWPDDENLKRRSRHGGIIRPIDGPLIDDEALKCVLGLPRLKSLDLAFSSVGDAGIKHVAHLQELEELRLEGSDVSDLSVPILSQMRGLKRLNVEHTKITHSGSGTLEAALPGCDVRGPHNDKSDLSLWFESRKRRKN